MSGLTDRQKYKRAVERQKLERRALRDPNPERITMALDLRWLSGPEVDRACGAEEPAVDLWEAGDLVPTAEQVAKLAALTGFPVAFFYLPSSPPVGPVFVCSRGRCEVIDSRPDAVVRTLPVAAASDLEEVVGTPVVAGTETKPNGQDRDEE